MSSKKLALGEGELHWNGGIALYEQPHGGCSDVIELPDPCRYTAAPEASSFCRPVFHWLTPAPGYSFRQMQHPFFDGGAPAAGRTCFKVYEQGDFAGILAHDTLADGASSIIFRETGERSRVREQLANTALPAPV